jgi:BirA family transcriptional regulator, biotin operon repressor / biotin---[acetyl-CoA-carboxylase] ligase
MPTDAQIETLLASRTRFSRLHHLASCPSTQDAAAAAPLGGDAIFWAEHQTAGRGRQARAWSDEPGQDLALTLRVTAELPQPLALPAALPVAVLDAIEPFAERRLTIKWPNDLFHDGRKLCGVLVDRSGAANDTYLIGVGINVNRTRFPAELEAIGTSLALVTGRLTDREALLLTVAERIDDMLTRLARRDHDELQARFVDRLGLVGRNVRVDAGAEHEGVLTALDFAQLTLDDERRLPLAIVRAIRRV